MKILSFLVIIWTAHGFFAQEYKETKLKSGEKNKINENLQNYLDATYNQDWNSVVDMLYPGIFQITSKEELVRAMENGTRSIDYKMIFHPSENIYIYPEVIEKDGKKYVLISYTNNFTMHFKKKPNENDFAFKGRMDYIHHKFKKRYPINQIIRGSNPGVFHFKIPKHMLAIYLPEKNQYSFIDFSTDPKKLDMLEKIIDHDIIGFFKTKIK